MLYSFLEHGNLWNQILHKVGCGGNLNNHYTATLLETLPDKVF